MSKYQERELPRLRRGLSDDLAKSFFRQNIIVTTSGKDADQLVLTGPVFFNNANIEDVQGMLARQLRPLRFRSVKYLAYEGARSWVYKLEVPADGKVGRFEGDVVRQALSSPSEK